MKRILLALLFTLPFISYGQLWTAQSVNVLTTNPDSCTAVNVQVTAYMGCINFTVLPGTFTVNGNNIILQVNCTSSPICAGAISYPLTGFNLGNLSPGTYTITAEAILDRIVTNTISGGTLTVAACSTTHLLESSIENIEVYPNPTSDKLFIDELGQRGADLNIKLFDIAGKEQTLPLNMIGSRMQMDLSKLESGVYFLQITEGEEKVIKKILVD